MVARVHGASIGNCITTCKRGSPHVSSFAGFDDTMHDAASMYNTLRAYASNKCNNNTEWTCLLNGTPLPFVPSQLPHRHQSYSATELFVAGGGFVEMAGRGWLAT